jgi:hypothetical protein
MMSFMMCNPRQILFGDEIEKEMGGEYSMYGGEERRIQGLGGKTRGKETTWKIQA